MVTEAILLAVLAAVAVYGVAHTGYRRGWYGNYNEGGPAIDGWGGLKLGIFAVAMMLVVLIWPYLHLGVSEP